jgi:hypothetical protein
MTKINSEYFMACEAPKVFAIRKIKTQFTNKNTHIYAQTYYRSMQRRRKLFFIERLKYEVIFKFRVFEMPFLGLSGSFSKSLVMSLGALFLGKGMTSAFFLKIEGSNRRSQQVRIIRLLEPTAFLAR